MKTLLTFIFAGILAIAFDGNVTGKWTGSFNMLNPDGSIDPSPALLVLKQTGAEITGTLGPDAEHQTAITKGSIDGSKVILQAEHQGNSLKIELLLAADQLTGEVNLSREDGTSGKAKIDVTRAK